MARLESIYITGIRSYGITDDDAQAFEFQSPVTIFLGENGCGKTTIIESIRHALTGDFPNGKTGKFFVTDPSLHKVNSVKACIKLKFRDIYGNPATIVKVIKLESKNDKCNTLDSTYEYIDRNNMSHQQSVKQTDCKAMLNLLFGIPEAVIENVLFCQQEDSLWPLSEDGNVKKKFDLLFDSSKYDKAVDILQKRVKDRKVVLKNLIRESDILRDLKESYVLKKQTLADREKDVKLLNKELEDLEAENQVSRNRLSEVVALEESFLRLHKLHVSKEEALKGNQMQQMALKECIKFPFNGSDRELLTLIDNADKHYAQKCEELKQIEDNIRALQLKRDSNAKEKENYNSQLASMKTQLKMLDEKEADLKERVANVLDGTPSENTFEQNIQLLENKYKSEKCELQVAQSACDVVEDEMLSIVDLANDEQMKISGNFTSKTNELASVQESKQKVANDLDAIQNLDQQFRNHRTQIANVEHQIEKLAATFDEAEMMSSIEDNKKRRREIEFELECLETEKDNHDKNALIEKEISFLTYESLNKGNQIHSLQNKNYDDLKVVFPGEVPTAHLFKEVEAAHKMNKANIDRIQKSIREEEICITSLEGMVRNHTEKRNSMQEELETSTRNIKKLCGESSFECKIKEVREENTRLQALQGQLKSSQIIYKTFIESLRKKKCCPVCETDFSENSKKQTKLDASMNTLIAEIPEKLKKVDYDLSTLSKLQENLLKLSSQNAKIADLMAQISEANEIIDSRKHLLVEEKNKLRALKSELESESVKATSCIRILPVVSKIDTFCQEMATAKNKISSLKAKLIPIASKRTQTDTELAMGDKKEAMRSLDEENERLRKKLSSNQKLFNELQTQKNNLVASQLELQKFGQGKPQLEEKQRELVQQEKQLRKVITKLQDDVNSAKANVAEAKLNLKEQKAANAIKMERQRTTFQALENTIKNIENLRNEVMAMKKKNFTRECSLLKEKMNELETIDAAMVDKNQSLAIERDGLRDELNDEDNRVSSLKNQKKLRELQTDEELINSALKSIATEIADKDYNNIEKEKLELQRKLGNITYNSSHINGKLEALNQGIRDIKTELGRNDKDPLMTYLLKKSEIEFVKGAIKDIMQTMAIMSSGISKFHREQLLAINVRLRELWRTTYKGNDIEFIEIQSGETDVSSSRRVYSYSVLQKRGHCIMQMRNKCSAGQKVLACLLIRIVLAEHFSARCGIFALDEPTTNLDRENIRSLSNVLANLIKTHSARRQLQFLIITHDEDFLEALRTVDATRNYYKVERNIRGSTTIKMHRL